MLADDEDKPETQGSYREYDNSIINGFLLATSSGPLCEEPLMGVCFVIENIFLDYGESEANYRSMSETDTSTELNGSSKKDILSRIMSDSCDSDGNSDPQDSENKTKEVKFLCNSEQCSGSSSMSMTVGRLSSRKVISGALSGQIISAVKDGCRQAFSLQPMRLMAAMYTCTIQTPADVLGKMYAVISKREGRVLGEEMKEGSDVFIVNAVLPVAESFGFTEEIRKRTSGLARPLLQFTHWEVDILIL